MESLLSNPLFGAISSLGLVAFGVYTIFDKKYRTRHTEYDQAGDGLIKLLKETKDEIFEEYQKFKREASANEDRMKIQIDRLHVELERISEEHEKMMKIFQGRDADTVKFREEGFKSFETVKEVHDKTHKTLAKIMNIEKIITGNVAS